MIRFTRSLGLLVILLALPAVAATSGRTTESVERRSDGSPMLLSVGPGLFAGGYHAGVSLSADAVWRVTRHYPIYAGIDTILIVGGNYSLLRYGYYDAGYRSSVGFGALATGYYNWTFPKKQRMHILGGLSLGPFFGGNYFTLALLIRAGFTYDLTQTISVTGEPLLGVIGSQFVFIPRGLFTFRL